MSRLNYLILERGIHEIKNTTGIFSIYSVQPNSLYMHIVTAEVTAVCTYFLSIVPGILFETA